MSSKNPLQSSRSDFLEFKSFTEKPVLEFALAHHMILVLVKKVHVYGSRLCDMQISYEMAILVPRGRAPFGQHQESRPGLHSGQMSAHA